MNPSTHTQQEINELYHPMPRPSPQETFFLTTNFLTPVVEELDDLLNDNTPPCNQIEPLSADLMQKDLDMMDLFLCQT